MLEKKIYIYSSLSCWYRSVVFSEFFQKMEKETGELNVFPVRNENSCFSNNRYDLLRFLILFGWIVEDSFFSSENKEEEDEKEKN